MAFKANERFFQTLDAQYIAQEIQSHVLSLKDWNAKVAGASEKSTQDARPVLKKALTEQSPS